MIWLIHKCQIIRCIATYLMLTWKYFRALLNATVRLIFSCKNGVIRWHPARRTNCFLVPVESLPDDLFDNISYLSRRRHQIYLRKIFKLTRYWVRKCYIRIKKKRSKNFEMMQRVIRRQCTVLQAFDIPDQN